MSCVLGLVPFRYHPRTLPQERCDVYTTHSLTYPSHLGRSVFLLTWGMGMLRRMIPCRNFRQPLNEMPIEIAAHFITIDLQPTKQTLQLLQLSGQFAD